MNERGEIGKAQWTLRWQVVRLYLEGIGPRIARIGRSAVAALYAVWWWMVVGSAGVIAWLAVMTLSRLEWRWAAIRTVARTALFAFRTIPAEEHEDHKSERLSHRRKSGLDQIGETSVLPAERGFSR